MNTVLDTLPTPLQLRIQFRALTPLEKANRRYDEALARMERARMELDAAAAEFQDASEQWSEAFMGGAR